MFLSVLNSGLKHIVILFITEIAKIILPKYFLIKKLSYFKNKNTFRAKHLYKNHLRMCEHFPKNYRKSKLTCKETRKIISFKKIV